MASAPTTHLPRIQVHPDGRFLVTDQGKPFFWLADTAWELFHRLTRDEARRYFANRSQKGFNVIQAVAVWPSSTASASPTPMATRHCSTLTPHGPTRLTSPTWTS